jgi:dolichol-phosphate mannosyltransferase|tara:strand:+ start:65 stop:763 length:699 start_codon:yes stop_codon:yes gene_type:complete
MISVILPTFNESGSILALIDSVHASLKDYDHEIIVADDNSPDNTFGILKDANLLYVTPILRLTDRGFAKSIRCGIEHANGEIIIVMDSDFNHNPTYLPMMIENLEFYDCVSASRFVYGGDMGNRTRHILSWMFNIFIRLMIRGQITDSLYGFFAIKKENIFQVKFDDVFWGYGDYCIRLMYYFQKKEFKVLQFPAINGERIAGEGNSGFIKVFLQYFREVIKLTYNIRFKNK